MLNLLKAVRDGKGVRKNWGGFISKARPSLASGLEFRGTGGRGKFVHGKCGGHAMVKRQVYMQKPLITEFL